MTLSTQGAPYLGGNTNWLWDDAAGDFVPVQGNTAIDLTRGIGRSASRALINQWLPTGTAIVQSANGAETNTFTTRVAIGGTYLNAFNFNGTQVAGTFPPGALSLVGRTIRVKAGGTLGTAGASTPNLTVDIGLGVAGANVLATTGVLAMATTTSPAPWGLDVTATVQTAGASGVVISEGLFYYSSTSSVVVLPWTMGNTVRGTGLAIDLTAALAFNIFATQGTSNAANRIIQNYCTVEILF